MVFVVKHKRLFWFQPTTGCSESLFCVAGDNPWCKKESVGWPDSSFRHCSILCRRFYIRQANQRGDLKECHYESSRASMEIWVIIARRNKFALCRCHYRCFESGKKETRESVGRKTRPWHHLHKCKGAQPLFRASRFSGASTSRPTPKCLVGVRLQRIWQNGVCLALPGGSPSSRCLSSERKSSHPCQAWQPPRLGENHHQPSWIIVTAFVENKVSSLLLTPLTTRRWNYSCT